MTETVATWIVNGALAYAAVGLVFAAAFVTKGAGRVDPDAVGGSLGFRLLILPGTAALWPLLATRWLRGRPAEESSPHRDARRTR